MLDTISAAMERSRVSPATWPNWSLYCLKWSRSTMATVSGVSDRRACSISISMRS